MNASNESELMELTDTSILVSGGSSGLGAACVRRLLARGARVLVADIVPPFEEIDPPSDRRLFVRADVTSEADVQAVIEAGRQRFGPLRGAVLCAGILRAERVLGANGPASLESFRRVVEVNLVGAFNVARLAAAAMAANDPDADGQRGVIVMTASVAAFEGQVGQAAYSGSKGGVASMALPLARDLASRGIRVVAIAPGVFETPMMQAMPDKIRTSLADQVPFPKRLGRPEEFAALVEHVFDNTMLNGCVLRLDGALRMGSR